MTMTFNCRKTIHGIIWMFLIYVFIKSVMNPKPVCGATSRVHRIFYYKYGKADFKKIGTYSSRT